MTLLVLCPNCRKDRPSWAMRTQNGICVWCNQYRKPPVEDKVSEEDPEKTRTALNPGLALSTPLPCEACGEMVELGKMEKHLRTHRRNL